MALNIKHSSTALLILMLGLSPVVSAQTSAASDGAVAQVSSDIEQLLAQENLVIEGEEILAQDVILHVYQDNAFKPYWTDKSNIRELMQLIEEAPDHGLDPADYNIAELRLPSPLRQGEGQQSRPGYQFQARDFPRPASRQDHERNPGCTLSAGLH